MKFEIITPSGSEVTLDDIHSVRTELSDGKPLTILPRHAPLMGEISNTSITATTADHVSNSYAVKPGVLVVMDDVIKILTSGLQEGVSA